jgi:hypothetical protein
MNVPNIGLRPGRVTLIDAFVRNSMALSKVLLCESRRVRD